LKDLKDIMNREVVETLDHRHLNKEIIEFARRNPTTESIAVYIWQRLASKLKIAKLHRVRLYESHDLFVDFLGEA
jgi:6-pyruvoyltetrahydropterin/6-carboxytetrahydropterin synthase